MPGRGQHAADQDGAVQNVGLGTSVSTPSGAVFHSDASEDSEAAERIADAPKAAGIDVWFD
jgi:hypothetical protein